MLMIVILQRAPDGLWPALARRLPLRIADAACVRPEVPPLAKRAAAARRARCCWTWTR